MNYSFDLRKNWSYLVFIIPYVLLSLLSFIVPSIATKFEYSDMIMQNFQFYRFITMFLLDTSIISIIFTVIISKMFFQFLSEITSQLKITILLFLSMFISGGVYSIFSSRFSFGNLRVGFLFFTLIFFFAIIISLFLYRDEVIAQIFLNRFVVVIFLNIILLFISGVFLIFLNMIIAFSIFIVIFITYYFTEPKTGYLL